MSEFMTWAFKMAMALMTVYGLFQTGRQRGWL
jgi:hypothetical protein